MDSAQSVHKAPRLIGKDRGKECCGIRGRILSNPMPSLIEVLNSNPVSEEGRGTYNRLAENYQELVGR